MKELIDSIVKKHQYTGIKLNAPATIKDIQLFEQKIGFTLPQDFKEFYSICNGFECEEDIFSITPLSDITIYNDHYGKNWFYFSEYMTYCDMWALRINSIDKYEIFNDRNFKIIMTSSLIEFLEKFLKGNVFDEGGLYHWMESMGIK